MNRRKPVTDARTRKLRMISHPFLDEPKLSASAANIVLSGGIEHTNVKAALDKLGCEVCGKLNLMSIAGW